MTQKERDELNARNIELKARTGKWFHNLCPECGYEPLSSTAARCPRCGGTAFKQLVSLQESDDLRSDTGGCFVEVFVFGLKVVAVIVCIMLVVALVGWLQSIYS